MKIVDGPPPNYAQIRAAFGESVEHPAVVFTYGDTVYHRGPGDISEHVLAHEYVHMKQQGMNPKLWWDRYIAEPAFRLVQEMEAYQWQYRFMAPKIKDRNERAKFLHALAKDLCSGLYGKILSYQEALAHIKTMPALPKAGKESGARA